MSRINDAHVHLGHSSIINQKLLSKDISNFRKKFKVNHFMLFTLDVDIEKNNNKIIQLSKKFKYIHGLYWIQKKNLKTDLEILDKELGNGLVGVKFHGVFEKQHVNSRIYIPIMKLLNKNHSILLVHCGRFKDGHPSSNSSFVHALNVAKKFPDIKVILAHMGGNDTSVVKKAINAAKTIPNAFFDTSGISTPYRVEYAVEKIGAKRVLFGSDYPWCSHKGMFYGVDDALITKKEKDLILRRNFLTLVSDA